MNSDKIICIVFDEFEGCMYFYAINDLNLYQTIQHGAYFTSDNMPLELSLAIQNEEKLTEFPVSTVQETTSPKVISVVIF